MHAKRLATWLLGLWIGCSLFMFLVATHNFRAVDGMLKDPAGARELIVKLGPAEARQLLRYHSSELNRFYFQAWEFAQFGLLAAVAGAGWSAFGGRKTGRILLVLVAAILLLERMYLTPQIVEIGRVIDFADPSIDSEARAAFWKLHGMYSGVEVLKVMFVGGLSLLLFSKRHDSRGDEAAD